MPPKKEQKTDKPRRRVLQFQDLEPGIRRHIIEFLQPPIAQQQSLRSRYESFANARNTRRAMEQMEDDPMFVDMAKREEKALKSHYHKLLEKTTKVPGIHETYGYFWDEKRPFPDQEGGAGGGGAGPITT